MWPVLIPVKVSKLKVIQCNIIRLIQNLGGLMDPQYSADVPTPSTPCMATITTTCVNECIMQCYRLLGFNRVVNNNNNNKNTDITSRWLISIRPLSPFYREAKLEYPV